MALNQPTSCCESKPFDQEIWVSQIRSIVRKEYKDYNGQISIFSVPKTLMASDPNSYTPQKVAFGPYHFLRPELKEMEMFKLPSVTRLQFQGIDGFKFEELVKELTKDEDKIRACYDKYLDFSGDTLAWMMVIDASFLLDFLQYNYTRERAQYPPGFFSRMLHLFDFSGRSAAHNIILRDIVMLENQVPLFVLRKRFEFQYSRGEAMFCEMLKGLHEELTPFKQVKVDLPNIEYCVSESSHLLEFLYRMITPEKYIADEEQYIVDCTISQLEGEGEEGIVGGSLQQGSQRSFDDQDSEERKKQLLSSLGDPNSVWRLVKTVFTAIWKLEKGNSKLPKAIEKLPLKDGSSIIKKVHSSENSIGKKEPPLIEEIDIPSVTQLSWAGVLFLPTEGSISSIEFDSKTGTFSLPSVTLDSSTKIIMRNLVAYEAANTYGLNAFTRYTELMNGIIDTKKDVKLLRERGIIFNRFNSDLEAANMWNGMSKSIKLTKLPDLDKVIKDVNDFYDEKWKVKFRKFMKTFVFGSWPFLSFIAVFLMLFLTAIQSFCSVYSCPKLLKFISSDISS